MKDKTWKIFYLLEYFWVKNIVLAGKKNFKYFFKTQSYTISEHTSCFNYYNHRNKVLIRFPLQTSRFIIFIVV